MIFESWAGFGRRGAVLQSPVALLLRRLHCCFASLSRSSATADHFIGGCCMLCVDIIFAPRFGAAAGAARKDLGAGETGRKKFFIYFFKKMRKSVAFYIFLWYYVSEEAYRRLLPSRQRTAEVGY